MNAWKKFKLGKWKDENENKEKEVGKDRDRGEKAELENNTRLFHFHHSNHDHHHHHKHQNSQSSVTSDDFFVDRKKTIVKSPSSIAPVRLSSEVLSSTSTMKDTSIAADSRSESSRSESTAPTTGTATSNHHTNTSAGIMTIKVYNGEDFTLPIPITSKEQILSRLLGSGINSLHHNLSNEVNTLISQLSKIQLEAHEGRSSSSLGSPDENLIDGKLATNYIPATVMLPASTKLNPLLYFTIEFDNTVATIEPEYGLMSNPIFNKISTFDVTRKLPFLKIDVFARIPSILLPPKMWQQIKIEEDRKMKKILEKINSNQDIHLGSVEVPVNLKINSAANIRLYNHHWISLDNGMGKINISIDYKPSRNKPLSIDDFDLLKVIGKGSFGKVMQVRKKDTQKIYALKAIRKSYIVSKSEVTHTLAERTVLARVNCPFIVPLKFSFQSSEKLYLVLACINGGELFYHLQREGRFDLSRARFYTAELLCALETLHNLNVIYRDLKPENILLDYQGHIALCDFGLCKLNMKDDDKTDTFCGTPEYLAPELLLGQGYTKVVDWWTLGILLYEMLTGLPPYYDEDVPRMYRKILQDPLRFPDGFDQDAKDLLIQLLNRDPLRRLGCNGADEIKSHPFFSQLSWKRLVSKGYIPPYKPPVASSVDTRNFDQEFTSEKPVDSVVDEYLSESVQKQFGGWTYVGNEQLGSSMVGDNNI
ncbi:putative protein kinase YPK2 NDAI_0H02340 [Naumovozyma dairenensis CBS 421]|uniref:non-specific serine/threonine protein kinase n=1 Tax=Naumovozyma dairenensis (strain ATCC 10597 / BCRC 20456 / CBS 421 / NBRC 0211 / NRRL Y-12639) TaxID=1071378 RepID=G0WF47_NAUDC|nr:hypothetical protein NDAI_0H02340 [Naumovozyma dairenensis CBS 421]CCD26408.1 hypothetical protein NDAI_0H02340 [Naumovozyma dairenensis CBS 421]